MYSDSKGERGTGLGVQGGRFRVLVIDCERAVSSFLHNSSSEVRSGQMGQGGLQTEHVKMQQVSIAIYMGIVKSYIVRYSSTDVGLNERRASFAIDDAGCDSWLAPGTPGHHPRPASLDQSWTVFPLLTNTFYD